MSPKMIHGPKTLSKTNKYYYKIIGMETKLDYKSIKKII